jgi:hypothetical protein
MILSAIVKSCVACKMIKYKKDHKTNKHTHANIAAVVRASAFHLWVRGFDSRYGLVRKESVKALSKVVGFLRVLRFPPTRKVDRVG